MQKLAIIGTGIAGMACGYFLRKEYDLTVYEQNDYIGGHTNTITADEDGTEVAADSGFMVYNQVTYPLLTKLFAELDAPTMPTSMSFSVQHVPAGLEYCGSGLNGLFAQRKNIFSPRFIRMLMQISRFNKESIRILGKKEYENQTVEDFCKEHELGNDFLYKYLIPMSSAVWSTPMDLMLRFPAQTLVRFFYNHGFLGLNTQHQWYTLRGGSRMYREKIIAPFRDRIRVNCGVLAVTRAGEKVRVKSADGQEAEFDKVIMAGHGDEAYKIMQEKTAGEERLLSKFKYQENSAILHTDESAMPRLKSVWSSWNYRIEEKNGNMQPATIYWMNSLQQVSKKKNYFVTINDTGRIDPKKIIWQRMYEHPLFDVPAMLAQRELPALNENGPVHYCGSYFRYGFHEDALLSAVNLCEHLLKRKVL
ncbi:MAG: dehydrogenase [Bacteroidetes bacterium]|nr:MAG: dehydrogenase [Bacteroidota bacterium]